MNEQIVVNVEADGEEGEDGFVSAVLCLVYGRTILIILYALLWQKFCWIRSEHFCTAFEVEQNPSEAGGD